MTTEQLRSLILGSIDSAQNYLVSWAWLSSDQRKVIKAVREYWHGADEATLQTLLALFNKEP